MARKKMKWAARRKFAGFGISLLLSLAIVAIYVLSQPEFHRIRSRGILDIIEAKTLDLRFRLRGKRQPADNIVIIAMDEKTEDDLGRWQSCGRRWIAQMVNILHEGGAKVIGFDVTLAEPDEGAVPEAIERIKTYLEATGTAFSELTPRSPLLQREGGGHVGMRFLRISMRSKLPMIMIVNWQTRFKTLEMLSWGCIIFSIRQARYI